MYSASNFIGAWFWDIGTGIRPILLFYTTLFVVMVVSFGLASRIRAWLPSSTMMTLGIALNALYLALLLILRTHTRQYYIPLAALDGLSASFYWLSLYVLAASWVKTEQASWYNSWTGAIEAILGLVAPPLAGWIIAALPGLYGYQAVFFAAFVSLLACTWLILAVSRERPPLVRSPLEVRTPVDTRTIPQWRRLCWSFWGLGMRDGMYFFVPNLLLYIVTGSTVLLGAFAAMQAALQGAVFWALTRSKVSLNQSLGMLIAAVISVLALGILAIPLTPAVLFMLGAVIAISYPSFKVALESTALAAITRYGRDEQERTRLTGVKEVWINGGRLFSLVFLVLLLTVLGPLHIPDFRWILGLWSFIPVALYLGARKLLPPDLSPQAYH